MSAGESPEMRSDGFNEGDALYDSLFKRFGGFTAAPKPGSVHSYKDANTGEAEKSAECKYCRQWIEMDGADGRHIHWVHSDSLAAERCIQAWRDSYITSINQEGENA